MPPSRRSGTAISLVVAALVATACPGSNGEPSDESRPSAGSGDREVVTFDCSGAPTCPPLEIEGDAAATLPTGEPSPFRGYADPSVRRDPETGRLWLAYSSPSVSTEDGRPVPAVDTHLASSDDDGRTWDFVKVLWASTPTTDRGGDGASGFTDHEVPDLLPVEADGTTTWYGVRVDYFLPTATGFAGRPLTGFRLVVTSAESPEALDDASAAVLGSALTAPGWGVTTDLTTLSTEVSSCQLWNEPTLWFTDDQLFLAARCLTFDSETGVPDLDRSALVVFATTPSGAPPEWEWRFAGQLAGPEAATALGGDGLTQVGLAEDENGRLLALVTPDRWSEELDDFVHLGCRVVEVASLDPPELARDSHGGLVVRASIEASEQGEVGPGACAYDPASETGILMTLRDKAQGTLAADIHETGVQL